MEILVDTAFGPARAHLHDTAARRGVLVLGHGAGGGVSSADLVAVRDIALRAGVATALVEQPYRVAGRRAPAPAAQLDAAWTTVVDTLRATWSHDLPLVVGGRSSGARVACRTAAATGAAGVLCLAFPVQPPQGKRPEPRPTRLPELDAVALDVLVVQGERDAFGVPPAGRRRTVCLVPGDHSLRQGIAPAASAVAEWLAHVIDGSAARPA